MSTLIHDIYGLHIYNNRNKSETNEDKEEKKKTDLHTHTTAMYFVATRAHVRRNNTTNRNNKIKNIGTGEISAK